MTNEDERQVILTRLLGPSGPEVSCEQCFELLDEYVDLVIGPMLDACAPHARWIDVFCETGAFTVAQSRRVLEAGPPAQVLGDPEQERTRRFLRHLVEAGRLS